MDNYYFILFISIIVISTYVLDFFSRKIKVPAILFLILIGMAFRYFADTVNYQVPFIENLIPILGNIALILIVLEGGFDLELEKEKKSIIVKSLISALILLFLTAFAAAALFYFQFGTDYYNAFVNAVPFAVISSAIAIPSVLSLNRNDREFVIYESSLSDIFGIMLFNFVIYNTVITFGSIGSFMFEFVLLCVFSVLLTFAISILVGRINQHVKYIPILAIVFLIYSAAKVYHLSPLIFILLFGLFLNNTDFIVRGKLDTILKTDALKKELPQFKKIVAELTFIFKVFFFIAFGYSVNISELLNLRSIEIALMLTASIFILRIIVIKLFIRKNIVPLSFVAPRGLITILLVLSIPGELRIAGLNDGIIIWTVFFSIVILTLNILFYKEKKDDLNRVLPTHEMS